MAKSADNFLTLNNVLIQKGINPLAYRFAALQIHYRKPMEYSEAGLKQAALGLNSLFSQVASLGNEVGVLDNKLRQEFLTVINDDLNLPKALALVSMVMKAKLSAADKLATILDFDKVLGLDLDKAKNFVAADIKLEELPAEVKELVLDRQKAREAKDWAEADRLRQEIDSRGYIMEDSAETYRLTKKI